MMHLHSPRTSCATSAVRRANCFASSALARGRVRMPEPNLRRMRLGFLNMRSCYTNRKRKARKSNFRDFIRPQIVTATKIPFPIDYRASGSKVEAQATANASSIFVTEERREENNG